MSARAGTVIAALVLALAVTACTSTNDRAAQRVVAAIAEPKPPPATKGTAPTTTTTPPTCDPTASFRPTGPLPAPGQMPAGTFLKAIQDRGRLVVGVDENTLYFSYRDPNTGALVGFEPDLARAIAQAIFGDPSKVEFKSVVTAQKIPAVVSGLVDMTISVVSASCDRWRQVAFSTTYYETTQRILVRNDSPIKGLADLDDRRVCATRGSATARGSSQIVLEDHTKAIPVLLAARTDCLVALQEGRVEAILLPNSILAGLQAQDPTTKILPGLLQQQSYGIPIANSYGIPIANSHADLVRFVNALLERWRNDGTLAALQAKWLPEGLRTDPAAPAPRYQD